MDTRLAFQYSYQPSEWETQIKQAEASLQAAGGG